MCTDFEPNSFPNSIPINVMQQQLSFAVRNRIRNSFQHTGRNLEKANDEFVMEDTTDKLAADYMIATVAWEISD